MKLHNGMLLIALALAANTKAENSPALPMRDVATHEQLVAAWRETGVADPMRTMEPAKGPDPSKVNQPQDLISQSDIICFGEMATLVPKRAILQTPAKFAERLKFRPGAQIQSWAVFHAANRGWITTVEVTRVQAEGNLPLAADVTERLKDSTNLVVATYMGGPISVLPLKEPAPETTPPIVNRTAKAKP